MIKQNPFSIYDFLGYLVPGSIFIYAFVIIDYIKKNGAFSIQECTKYIGDVSLDNIFLFVIVAYILGHILSFVSSSSVELYANWRYFYPSKYLLDIKHKGYWRSARKWQDVVWRVFIMVALSPIFILDWSVAWF